MKVLAEIEVETLYRGRQQINQVEIFTELNEHKDIGWKVDGIYGSTHYILGFHYGLSEAIDQFSDIQCRLLRAQEEAAEKRIGWKVDGIYGSTHYILGFHYGLSEAIDQFSDIQCRLLRAQEEAAEKRR